MLIAAIAVIVVLCAIVFVGSIALAVHDRNGRWLFLAAWALPTGIIFGFILWTILFEGRWCDCPPDV